MGLDGLRRSVQRGSHIRATPFFTPYIRVLKIMEWRNFMGETKFIKRSPVTGKKYDYFSKEYVRILNVFQAASYLNAGLELIDLYVSNDKETQKNRLVFVFEKEASKPYFDKWCSHELD